MLRELQYDAIRPPVRVLITDISSYKAIVFSRSLSRKGVEVISSDSRRYTSKIRTRHSSRHYLYPSPAREPDAFLQSLREVVRLEKPDLVMPTNSREMRICLRQRDVLGTALRYLGSLDAFEMLDNKSKLEDLAEELGIPCPRHYSIHDQVESFPLVFKPAQESSSSGVRYLRGEKELAEIRVTSPAKGSYVLQEYIQGEGVGLSALCREGSIIAQCAHRRLAEIPIRGGSSTIREQFSHPELLPIAEALVRRTRWSGLVMFEFKLALDGRVFLIEANPRIWGSISQSIEMGVDFPSLLAFGTESRVQAEPRPATTYLSPLHWISLAQYVVRRADLRPFRLFLSRWNEAVPDVSLRDDPLGYLSVVLRAVGPAA